MKTPQMRGFHFSVSAWCSSRRSRWVGIVALLGAISFLITFLAVITGTGEDSVRLLSRRPGARDLVDRHEHREIRAVATTARELAAREADA
jgi:hypothetical protein